MPEHGRTLNPDVPILPIATRLWQIRHLPSSPTDPASNSSPRSEIATPAAIRHASPTSGLVRSIESP